MRICQALLLVPLTSTLCDSAMPDSPVLVIGIGNQLRGDDSASGEVVRRLHERGAQTGIEVIEQLCEPNDLLEVLHGRDAVVLVDTMRSGDPPGTIRRFDASSEPLPARLRGSVSTHAFGLHEAIELARALHRLPRRVIVFAVEGRHFEAGAHALRRGRSSRSTARMRRSPCGHGAGEEVKGRAADTPRPKSGRVAAAASVSRRRHATAPRRRTLGVSARHQPGYQRPCQVAVPDLRAASMTRSSDRSPRMPNVCPCVRSDDPRIRSFRMSAHRRATPRRVADWVQGPRRAAEGRATR